MEIFSLKTVNILATDSQQGVAHIYIYKTEKSMKYYTCNKLSTAVFKQVHSTMLKSAYKNKTSKQKQFLQPRHQVSSVKTWANRLTCS